MMEPRYCANCVHLLGVRADKTGHPFWKCAYPANVTGESNHPVTGEVVKEFKWATCVELRQSNDPISCGPVGKWWELYVPPKYIPTKPHANVPSKSADDLLSQLGI